MAALRPLATESDNNDSITGDEDGKPTGVTAVDSDEASGVVESKVRLIPACWQSHGASKGKRRQADNSTLSTSEQQCGGSMVWLCENGILTISEENPVYRLKTSNPEEDLKRWLLIPNDTLTTTTDVRDPSIVRTSRYTDATLLCVFEVAIAEIQAENTHIRSLIDYAARSPYEKVYRTNDTLGQRYEHLQVSCFANVDRETLEQQLLLAAYELRCVRRRAAHIGKRIEEFKVAEAQSGDWAEIEDLLRLGAVDEEWVRDECYV